MVLHRYRIPTFRESQNNPQSNHMFNWLVVWNFFDFSNMLGIIIPTDFHIFQRSWNHQPVNVFTHFGAYGSHNNSKCHHILGEFLCRQAGALSLCAWLGRWPRDLDIGVLNRSLMWYENQHTVDGRNPTPPWMVETLEIMNGMFTIYQLVSTGAGFATIHSIDPKIKSLLQGKIRLRFYGNRYVKK